MHHILQSYLRRLTNLSGSNRSLLLMRLIADHFVDLHQFDYVNGQPSFNIIQQLISRKSSIPLCKSLDSRDDKTNSLSRALKKLDRTDKFITEERGSKDLYVGWPFIRGKFLDGSLVRCPLIFFPVSLELVKNEWLIHPREDVNISFNKSFLLAYSHFNQVELEESLIESVFDENEKDSRIFRTELYQILKESPVELNFNQENFLDKLIDFENFKKQDFEEKHKTGELKMYPEAVMGIFPQAGSYLVPDYEYLIENNKFDDIEDFFLHRSVEEDKISYSNNRVYSYFLNKIKEDQTFTPFEIDVFQENAIKAVKRGNSLVVQGPPGSGKSQLICNLISDFIARGKKVLLVSQKKVALDVVHQRLNSKGMADFVGLVHDFKNDRKKIYNQILHQIDNLLDYKVKNTTLDAIQLERRFLQVSHKIDQIVEELDEFKHALFDENECKLPIKELYLTSDINNPHIGLKQEYRHFDFDNIEEFIPVLRLYVSYFNKFSKGDYPWKNRISFQNYTINDLVEIKEIIQQIPIFQEQISNKVLAITNSPMLLEEGEAILGREEKIKELLRHLKNENVYRYFRHMVSFKDSETDYLWVGTMERVVMECFKGVGPEVSLDVQELGNFQAALQRRIDAGKGFIKYINWHLFSKEKEIISKVLAANGLGHSKSDFKNLVEKVDNRLNLEHNLTKLRNYKSLIDVPRNSKKEDLELWFTDQKKAVLSKLIFSSLRNFKEYFNVNKLSYEELQEKIEDLLIVLREIPRVKNRWLTFLTSHQIHFILEEPNYGTRLIQTLVKDFEDLCDYDSLTFKLKPHEVSVLNKLIEASELQDEHSIEELFQNSIRLAWIDHIETKYPVLRAVSSIRFDQMLTELQDCVKEKMKISADIVLLKTRERTYEHLEFNRLNNQVTYRDLKHQVSKRKKIWPIRKLITNFYFELFDLIPCWMAFPEAVSAIFPMEQIFDLVIFDEASQCYVERGIPAMYRGKQVVVAGDDKQLSPYDLYKIRWEETVEDEPTLEIDSLLDLTKQYLMQVMLQGHYRSRSLDLIDFSNTNFYKGSLTMLPEFSIVNSKEPAIEYLKVEGVWENNMNPIEADRTVSLIVDLLKKYPEKEIGVITFNYKQQNYIIDLLEEKAKNEELSIPTSLFVKNIENVQGDEKDIIIFSIGYAPDAKGKMIMQFGSLNQEKGENRLNVAITRAKEKIFVVSSIVPSQLKIDELKNEGPKLLKSYLQYAQDISSGKYKPNNQKDTVYRLEWYLKNQIRKMFINFPEDVTVKDDLPFADLFVTKNSQYLGAFFTDDDLYHQSISVKESHVYKPFALSIKNWRHKQFFSRDYWYDKEALRESVMKFIKDVDN